tara:strand:- start:2002 stop:2976 length:975 start_codon:yes stop_codon:yes gene_type:complete
MNNNIILIFGGTGSLGYELNKRYLKNNIIYNYSRDEHKHWKMKLFFNNNNNLNFIIGNVSDKYKVNETINRVKPNIIIIASALKHIDQCELNTSESINTNLLGIQYILDSIESSINNLSNLNTVLFVSSDKACNPINNYGMCKAISETLIIEKSYYIPNINFIIVRYGNVLNSNGSIIPKLHLIGKNNKYTEFTLTHNNMTRFIMTLKQSVDLIEYAILNAETGDTIIPNLISMNIKDLLEIFAEKYNKNIVNVGIRPGEKLNESLINKTQSGRIVNNNNYIHIKSVFNYKKKIDSNKLRNYDSTTNILSKNELKIYLKNLNLL